MRILIIIPTLNEIKNIKILFEQIKRLGIKFDILFIDDNSTDGTQQEIKTLKRKNKNISFYFRPAKLGIGSAHKVGLIYGFKKKYKKILTMDADGTHNPKYIKQMLSHSNRYNLIITNRFLKKNSIRDWPLFRKFLTSFRYYLINVLLGFKFDSSGAYRCYDVNKIKLEHILLAKDDSYSFFWESIYHLNKNNYSIKEIAVDLPYRKVGSSKMKIKDIVFALIYLARYSIRKYFF